MNFFARYAAVVAVLAATIGAMALPANAGGVAYISLGSVNKLLIVDITKDAVVGKIVGLAAVDLDTGRSQSIALNPAPYHLAVLRGTGKLYVSSSDEPKIWVWWTRAA